MELLDVIQRTLDAAGNKSDGNSLSPKSADVMEVFLRLSR